MNYNQEMEQMKRKVATFATDFNPLTLVRALRQNILEQIADIASKEQDHVFKFYEDIEREDGSLDSERMPEFDVPCIVTCATNVFGGATFGNVGSVESEDGVTPNFRIYDNYGYLINVRTRDISLDDLVEILNSMY